MEYVASLLREENIIRNDDRRPTSGLKNSQNMLNEVQLLIASLNDEVVAIWCLIRALVAEGRIGEDYVIALSLWRLVNGIDES